MQANSKSVIKNICAVAKESVTPKKKLALADPEYIHRCQTVGPRADVMINVQPTINFCCMTEIKNIHYISCWKNTKKWILFVLCFFLNDYYNLNNSGTYML